MKMLFLRMWVMLRRFRRGGHDARSHGREFEHQVESLMRRATPFAGWSERANWMTDVARWLRQGGGDTMHERHARLHCMLDWLDANRDVRKLVQATLQKTVREAAGADMFCATGLPREPAFFSELSERAINAMLPRPLAQHDAGALLTAMFRDETDAAWLLEIDRTTLSRLARLCMDDGIVHLYLKQVDEALVYLVSTIAALGVGSEFRQRLDPNTPLQATPFMALRREMEKFCQLSYPDPAAVRSVRMLIAVCQAQTDRIYAHLDEHGVSVGLVYQVERMRAQLARAVKLIDLRMAVLRGEPFSHVQHLLVDLIGAHRQRASVSALVRRSFSLLARKMVERNAGHGEHYIARTRAAYRGMLRAAAIGGVVTAFTVLGKFALADIGAERLIGGVLASMNFAASFILITALGGVLATKQPAVTAPALAAKMGDLHSRAGLRSLLAEVACLLRSQAAAVFGNLAAVIPVMIMLASAIYLASGAPVLAADKARANLEALSVLGVTPFYAAFTGVLLWLSGLAAGFADNWFALRKLGPAIAHQRRLVHALGPRRAARLANWCERRVAGLAGNLALAAMLGMGPVLLHFMGVPLDVRHVTLATGTLVASVASLGAEAFAGAAFWLAAAGIAAIGLLNVGVAFACALGLALRARDVPALTRRIVFCFVLRRLGKSPRAFLLPPPEKPVRLRLVPGVAPQPQASQTPLRGEHADSMDAGRGFG